MVGGGRHSLLRGDRGVCQCGGCVFAAEAWEVRPGLVRMAQVPGRKAEASVGAGWPGAEGGPCGRRVAGAAVAAVPAVPAVPGGRPSRQMTVLRI